MKTVQSVSSLPLAIRTQNRPIFIRFNINQLSLEYMCMSQRMATHLWTMQS